MLFKRGEWIFIFFFLLLCLFVYAANPSITQILLNTTLPSTNDTNQNLTSFIVSSDSDGDSVEIMYNWYVDGVSWTVLHLPFVNSTSNVNRTSLDYSGYENHANVSSGVTWARNGYDGNGAYTFNTSSFLSVNNSASLRLGNNVSIIAWVKRNRLDGIDFILEKGGDWNLGEPNYALSLHSSNNRMLYFLYDGGWRGTTGVNDLGWHHYAAVFQNGAANGSLYIDGILQSNQYSDGSATVTLTQSSRDLHIGAQVDPAASYYGNNTIASVRVFPRLLSAEQVYADFLNATYIVSNETNITELWSFHATPNDGTQDGTTLSSNNVTILPVPLLTSFIVYSPLNDSAYSSSFLVNMSIGNATSALYRYENVSTNSSWTSLSSLASLYWNGTFNLSSVGDGNYSLRFNASDVNSFENLSVTGTFTIDRTDPTILYSCDSLSVFSSQTITCTCSVSDAESGISSSSYTQYPSTSAVGSFSTSCTATNRASLQKTSSLTYEVKNRAEDVGGGSGGGGGSSSSGSSENSEESSQDVDAGSLSEGQSDLSTLSLLGPESLFSQEVRDLLILPLLENLVDHGEYSDFMRDILIDILQDIPLRMGDLNSRIEDVALSTATREDGTLFYVLDIKSRSGEARFQFDQFDSSGSPIADLEFKNLLLSSVFLDDLHFFSSIPSLWCIFGYCFTYDDILRFLFDVRSELHLYSERAETEIYRSLTKESVRFALEIQKNKGSSQ